MKIFSENYAGKTVMITAGPTYEEIDPVRFIGNYSSGKMGFALAEVFASCGAKVILITGPVMLQVSHPAIRRINVTSADQMFSECSKNFGCCDVAVLAAAVADYKPVVRSQHKVKKSCNNLQIELTRTVDIAKELGRIKQSNQLMVGFALETEDEENNALQKLVSKNLDFIVLNSLQDSGAGFRHDTNIVTIFSKEGLIHKTGLMSKHDIAFEILGFISESVMFATLQTPHKKPHQPMHFLA